MNPMDQSRRRRFQPSGGRGCCILSGILLILLAGCDTGVGSRRQSYPDPLVGAVPSSPTPVPPPNPPSNAPTQTASNDLAPPLPASHTATGPASVAAGETATSEPGRNLRIGDSFAPTGASGNSAARGVAPAAVTVGSPEPASNSATSRLAPVPNLGVAGQSIGPPTGRVAAGDGLTFDQAQRVLQQYRVRFQRLDQDDDGLWKFQCSVPYSSNAAMNRTYATTKGSPDYLTAIREVITQIDKDRH